VEHITEFSHSKSVLLNIHMISRNDTAAMLNHSSQLLFLMGKEGYSTRKVQKMISQADSLLLAGDYEGAAVVARDIEAIYAKAAEVNSTLSDFKGKIAFAQERDISIDSTTG